MCLFPAGCKECAGAGPVRLELTDIIFADTHPEELVLAAGIIN